MSEPSCLHITYTPSQKNTKINKIPIKHSCIVADNKILQVRTSACQSVQIGWGVSQHKLGADFNAYSTVSYRLNSLQASSRASSNETHWFGCDLKSLDSHTMWKRTYGSPSSSPTFLNNLARTLSILSPQRSQQLDRWDFQLLAPSRFSILSVLWKNRKRPLAHCYFEVMFCNFIIIIF